MFYTILIIVGAVMIAKCIVNKCDRNARRSSGNVFDGAFGQPGRQGAEHLQRTWTQLDHLELRISALEASVIERAGRDRRDASPETLADYAAATGGTQAGSDLHSGKEY